MSEEKKIFTGTYIFGNMDTSTSFGGTSGTITLPSYSKEALLYMHDSHLSTFQEADGAKLYNFNVNELEAMHTALGRLINDLRQMENLSRKNLLRDEAYLRE